jgi:hypothetical protein
MAHRQPQQAHSVRLVAKHSQRFVATVNQFGQSAEVRLKLNLNRPIVE